MASQRPDSKRFFTHFTRRPRLIGSALLGLVLLGLLLPFVAPIRAVLLGFDAGIAWFLFRTLIQLRRDVSTPQERQVRAREQQEGKWVVLAICLALVAVLVYALTIELHGARNKSPADVALAGSTILLTWLFVASVFAQHYAHSFYLQGGQLEFPGTEHPDYWDFLYFALVISMCCQTSDVAIRSTSMRRLATLHSVLSFFFNVIIIAMAVSVGASVF